MSVRDPSDLYDDPAPTEMLRRMPPVLYKYSALSGRRREWTRELIVDSRLYFASPASFNDPFDCRIPPSYDASELLREQHWRAVVQRNYPDQPLRAHKAVIKRMVADSNLPEGRVRLTEQFFESVNSNGVACFSTDPTSTLMWSYYAEGHTGVAIRFNMALRNLSRLGNAVGRLLPIEVHYQREFPTVNYFKSKTSELIFTVLGTKSLAWQHEQEWRLVLPRGVGPVRVPPPMVDGVILGIRVEPAAEAAVREWVAQRSPAVELLRVVNCPNSFDLQLVPA